MSEIDPEFGAAWRAASGEQPPAAIDDAIRAAARREVGAKPGRIRAAPRWVPLAAAATVAAIAVGIVEMTPPEVVSPATAPVMIEPKLRDAKSDTDKPMVNQPQREAPVAAPAPEVGRDAGTPVAKEQRGEAADENDRGAVARERSERFAAASGVALQEKKTLASRQTPQAAEEASERGQSLKQKTELAAASSAARPNADAPTPAAAAVTRDEPKPFPAASVPAEPGVSSAASPVAAAAPASAPAPPIAARKLEAQSSATGALSSNIAGARADNAEPAPAKDSAALGKATAGEADKVAPERRKDLAPLAPEEWIKRIRRLIADGRNDDAAKELVAFRREYKDRADALLPSDLRAFRR